MRAKELIEYLDFPKQENKQFQENKLDEWVCPRCQAEDLPDEQKQCPQCGYKVPEKLYDNKLRRSWENIYKKVFSRIKGKVFESDLPTANSVRFVNQLARYGIVKRLRNGRLVELLKIPREELINCFVESDMKKLWRMAYTRKKSKARREKIGDFGRAQRYQFL